MENIEKELQTTIETFGQPGKIIAGNEVLGETCKKHCECEIKVNGMKLRNDKVLLIYRDKNISLPLDKKPVEHIITSEEVTPPVLKPLKPKKQKRRN